MTSSLKPMFSVRVRVPGSSANLGPGFDALGLAIAVHDEWTVTGGRLGRGPVLRMNIHGTAPGVPVDDRNLMVSSFRRVFREVRKTPPALTVDFFPRLPVAGGMGSSSAAIVAGLVAANTVLKNPLKGERLLSLATEIEGHPDNVAPALLGGLCVAAGTSSGVRCVSWTDPALFRGVSAVLCSPQFELKTKKARGVLPARVPYGDAVFNVGRAALLVGALVSRRFDLLASAMEDRLHQPYRRGLIPGFDAVLAAARKNGAYGAALSGAGPTLLALAPTGQSSAVGRAMERAFARAGVTALSRTAPVDLVGARCETRR